MNGHGRSRGTGRGVRWWGVVFFCYCTLGVGGYVRGMVYIPTPSVAIRGSRGKGRTPWVMSATFSLPPPCPTSFCGRPILICGRIKAESDVPL